MRNSHYLSKNIASFSFTTKRISHVERDFSITTNVFGIRKYGCLWQIFEMFFSAHLFQTRQNLGRFLHFTTIRFVCLIIRQNYLFLDAICLGFICLFLFIELFRRAIRSNQKCGLKRFYSPAKVSRKDMSIRCVIKFPTLSWMPIWK
jgi:hypothetical protein